MYKCIKAFQTTNGEYYFLGETVSENKYLRFTPTEKNNFELIPKEWEKTARLVDDRAARESVTQPEDYLRNVTIQDEHAGYIEPPDVQMPDTPDYGGGGDFGGSGSSDSY